MIKNGFIKTCCISPKLSVGMPLVNAKEIVDAINISKASINLFPELCVTGYSCGDLFFNETLLKENEEAILYIVENNKENVLTIIGAPLVQEGALYNCAIVIFGKEILGIVPKTNLVRAKEFNDPRYFTSGEEFIDNMFKKPIVFLEFFSIISILKIFFITFEYMDKLITL